MNERHVGLMLMHAADLASEDGENPEYDRALVELCTRTLGLSHNEHGHMVAEWIGVKNWSYT